MKSNAVVNDSLTTQKIPDYKFVIAGNGCEGCDFRYTNKFKVNCSSIPCQKFIGMVAKVVEA